MKTGMAGWGCHGSALEHGRYSEKIADRRRARRCHCGCGKKSTHLGKANGVALASGCELSIARWVKDPFWDVRRRAKSRQEQNPAP
jgi:hypothetical protein